MNALQHLVTSIPLVCYGKLNATAKPNSIVRFS